MNSLILKERSFDYAAWEKKVKDCYQDAAPGIIALEEKAQKNNLDKRNKRLAILEKKWPEILRTIKESLPSSAEMEKLLASLGAPINPAQIGVSCKRSTRPFHLIAGSLGHRIAG